MRLRIKSICNALLAVTMVGFAAGTMARERLEELPPAPMTDGAMMEKGAIADFGTPEARAVPQQQINYDEVGYANIGGSSTPGLVSAAHASLDVPGYAEVTNLETGRTILVLVNDRAVPAGRILSLSEAAADQLEIGGQDAVPVRVRRTNPPEHERIALQQGRGAKERLETPPALLNALRKKLGPAPKGRAIATRPVASQPVPRPASRLPRPATGADFDRPPRRSGDPFIIEHSRAQTRPHWVAGAGRQDSTPPMRKPSAPMSKPSPASSGWFVQLAAYSSEERARSTASSVGGSIVRVGSIWRVHKGPFANEAAARAALGPLAAKGYPGAHVSR